MEARDLRETLKRYDLQFHLSASSRINKEISEKKMKEISTQKKRKIPTQ